jgi:uncharacterized glyoxalase superfamily protein PhnB
MKKLTPVLFVEAIEPSLEFWVGRLGFQKAVEVPHGDRLGFVLLTHEGVEVMLQTWASLGEDVPAVAALPHGTSSSVYVDVRDFEAVRKRLEGCEIVVPVRKTFYGATEIGVREPGGHIVLFAESS